MAKKTNNILNEVVAEQPAKEILPASLPEGYASILEANKPIGVATYQMFRELPKELKNELPSPEQIALLLEYIPIK